MYEFNVTPAYVKLRSLHVSAGARENSQLNIGPVTVILESEDDDEFTVEGTLSPNGILTGMAKLHRRLGLEANDKLEFDVNDDGNIVVYPTQVSGEKSLDNTLPPVSEEPKTVFQKKGLKHLHIEPFRPENLDNWEPETETDVYLAFGVLQEFTDFQYCCGASQRLLTQLGADYNETSKPDAILIDRTTDEYLMAEWKKYSSDFKTNHSADDVDVLVCWHDSETDSSVLPNKVLALHGVAKEAAETALRGV